MTNRRNSIISVFVVFLYSFALVLLSEYVQRKSVFPLVGFVRENPGVVVFCTFVLFFLTLFLICAFKSAFFGSALGGSFVYVLSCVEYYKYAISGSHLVAADMGFISNAGEISGFADIKPEVHIIKAAAALVLMLIFVSFLKPPFLEKFKKRILAAGVFAVLLIGLISPGVAAGGVYRLLGFDTEPAFSTMSQEKRFESDGFLGFLSQNVTEYMSSGVEKPEGYSPRLMETFSAVSETAEGKKTPNVVIIASESFSDLREISKSYDFGKVYESFDKALLMSKSGICTLPTFGGYTARSEFELIFGLPAVSMSAVPSPHSMLDEKREQNTLVRDFLEQGYATTYIHGFNGEFYNRSSMYSQYGFSKLLFEDAFDSGKDTYRRYISDAAIMEKIKKELSENQKPSFVFAMTMQNHQPYIKEGGSIEDELSYYLDGIEKTSDALYELLVWLESFEEETILLFVGDHLPFFTPQGGAYEKLGVTDENSERLYYQKYLMYSNYKELKLPKNGVSLFYLPHCLMKNASVELSGFTDTMLFEMERWPAYSIANLSKGRNEKLDAITYDRTFGECYLD